MTELRVALAGNPNTGKSTLFNALTGGNQHVGNWPGKTVMQKIGHFTYRDLAVEIIDLPGAYSLSAYSPDEEVARDFIVRARPDVVVDVVDATNLERNLYLTAQILETGAPVILVLNMADLAVRRGYEIDRTRLSRLLGGAPVVATAANRGEGLETLQETLWQFAHAPERSNGRYPSLFPQDEYDGKHSSHALFCPHCH